MAAPFPRPHGDRKFPLSRQCVHRIHLIQSPATHNVRRSCDHVRKTKQTGKASAPAQASYVEQVDNHVGELTVRGTLDFAARCLGVGHKEREPFRLCLFLVRRARPSAAIDDVACPDRVSAPQVSDWIQTS